MLFTGLWLGVLGILAAANLIIAKRPDARDAIAKIAPYQGWIGVISAIWGAWRLIDALLNIEIMKWLPGFYLTWVAGAALMLILGLMLGVGVIKTFVKNPQAQAKMDATNARLAPKQGTLGLIAIGVGVWMIIASFMWHM